MIEHLLAAAAAAQIVPLPAPMPPPPNAAWLAVGRDSYAERLRSQCMSERGVAAVIEIWWRTHQPDPAELQRERALRQELGEAAYTDPVDLPRLERALAASEAFQARHRDRFVAEQVSTLRALTGPDRVVYARTLTPMGSPLPPRPCPPAAAPRR